MSKRNSETHRPMRTVELLFIGAMVLGFAFKIMHWPGASMLIVVGGASMAVFYFPFAYLTLPAPKPMDQLPRLSMAAGAAICTAMAGLLAYVQHWPYCGPLLLGGSMGSAAMLPVALLVRYWHPRLDMYCDGLLIRCFILGALAFFIWSTFLGKPH